MASHAPLSSTEEVESDPRFKKPYNFLPSKLCKQIRVGVLVQRCVRRSEANPYATVIHIAFAGGRNKLWHWYVRL